MAERKADSMNIAQSIQADQEPRRVRELRRTLAEEGRTQISVFSLTPFTVSRRKGEEAGDFLVRMMREGRKVTVRLEDRLETEREFLEGMVRKVGEAGMLPRLRIRSDNPETLRNAREISRDRNQEIQAEPATEAG